MKNLTKIISAMLVGIIISVVPYGLFILLIEKVGPDSFHMNPQFVALLLGFVFLGYGGYLTGKLLAKFEVSTSISPLVIFSSPGLYIGILGFIINFSIDGYLAKDGVISLSCLTLALFGLSAIFTVWGFKKHIDSAG